MKFENEEPFTCSICSKILKTISNQIDNIDGGVVTQVWANFGSKHDGDVFQVCYCDECLDYLLLKRKTKVLGNYLGFPIAEVKEDEDGKQN